MFPADNYGSKWVKGMINWLKSKSQNGIKYSNLIVMATLECGLRRGKLIELVNEYLESGLIEVKEGVVYWVDADLKPSFPKVEHKEKVEDEKTEKPKKKEKKDKKAKTEIELAYEKHIAYCKENNQEPDTLEEYVKRFKEEEHQDEEYEKVDLSKLNGVKE